MLTPRELEVLILAADGLDTNETAGRLGTSFHTVSTQRERIRRKLKARNMTHALAIAFASGMIAPPSEVQHAVVRSPDSTPTPEPAKIAP